ncbi:HBR388Cp [Eremothecium sinecaudum]|uniref:Large ribosomal subunit protein mL54 n=1 Tax=Eremothecium sinecaudum TaxID=45286 RepID=A0A120K1E1_9SACH|nr:HBR388Cp [Eremothecium sinecaudum]AMD19289.1 HBR388Cp [Eremothecium sinecaudum]
MVVLRFISCRFLSTSVRAAQKTAPKVVSSCPAGTVINVQVKKSGPEIIAQEDSAYPEWLWTVLDKKAQAEKLAADPLKMRRKELRKQNREKIKQQNFLGKMK